jgi:hypothetical protein
MYPSRGVGERERKKEQVHIFQRRFTRSLSLFRLPAGKTQRFCFFQQEENKEALVEKEKNWGAMSLH